MSESEQDLATGRFIREHAANKARLVAMESERERIQKAFAELVNVLPFNVSATFNLDAARRRVQSEPLDKFDFSELLKFLEAYSELRKSIEQGEARLKQLGIR